MKICKRDTFIGCILYEFNATLLDSVHGKRGAAKRILVFKGDPHAVDGKGVVLVFVSVVVAGNMALHGRDVCDVLHAKHRRHI